SASPSAETLALLRRTEKQAGTCHKRETNVTEASHMFELPPPSPAIEIQLASRGYSKGLAQTAGAQVLIRGELESGPLFAQAQWKNIDTNNAGGEAIVLVGLHRRLGG